jgi:hypothetical protein
VVHEGVVVGELDEGPLPYGEDTVDLGQDPRGWLLCISLGEKDGACAKLAAVGAPPAGLDGEPIVLLDVQQLESRHGSLGKVEGWGVNAIEPAKASALRIFDDPQPGGFPLPHYYSVTVPAGFFRQGGYVEAADDRGRPPCPEPAGELVRLVDLRAVAGDGHQVEAARQLIQRRNVVDLDVLDVVRRRGHPGQGEEAEARQRRDGTAPLHEAGEGKAQTQQFRIQDPDAAHGDEPDVHDDTSFHATIPVAEMMARTGTKKRWRNTGFQAER